MPDQPQLQTEILSKEKKRKEKGVLKARKGKDLWEVLNDKVRLPELVELTTEAVTWKMVEIRIG